MKIDKQTISDLRLFNENIQEESLFSLINSTKTFGGFLKLRNFFLNPCTSIEKVIERQKTISFMSTELSDWKIPCNEKMMENIEKYLKSNIVITKHTNKFGIFLDSLSFSSLHSDELENGLKGVYDLLSVIKIFLQKNNGKNIPFELTRIVQFFTSFINREEICSFLKQKSGKVFYYDKIIRDSCKEDILKLLDHFYTLEAFYSIAKATKKLNFVFPDFLTEQNCFNVEGIFHPFIDSPVSNDISIVRDKSVVFLTGPNQAGKTTFLKACGITLYLAHIGMGVPAKKMTLSFFTRLFSSINTIDNIQKGYSYFYSEVKRVKEIARMLQKGEKIFAIFDELFKGTNVKDALDSTFCVINGFSKWKESTFLLSSHLTELESPLKNIKHVSFLFFESFIENNQPKYTYKIKSGISHERMGLLILKNEKIDELLNSKHD